MPYIRSVSLYNCPWWIYTQWFYDSLHTMIPLQSIVAGNTILKISLSLFLFFTILADRNCSPLVVSSFFHYFFSQIILQCQFWIGWYNFRQFAVSFLLYLWGIWCISSLQFIYHRILKNVLKEPSSNLLIFSGTIFYKDFVKLMTTMIHDDDINLKSVNLTVAICV